MTIRLRLTLVYGLLFVLGGVVLLGLSYTLVRSQLPPKLQIRAEAEPVPDGAPSDGEPTDQLLVEPDASETERFDALAAKLRDETLDELLRQSAAALVITAGAAFGLGWVVAGRALRPVHEITDAARRLSAGTLHERLDLDGPRDEITELADTFDEMLDRLEAAFERERRFVANASHELRTPLAVLRTQLEVGGEGAASSEQLLAVLDRSNQVIDGLLLLARSARLVVREPVDLADAAAVALAELEPDLVGFDVRASLDGAVTDGDSGLLEQVALNLVGNAARHGADWLEVRTAVAGDEVILSVANGGPTMTAEEAATLIEPFRRGTRTNGTSRAARPSGAGLGLSIVASVIDAHEGHLAVEPVAGGGLRVTAMLAAADVPVELGPVAP